MVVVLPLIGGFLLGRFASLRTAVIGQLGLYLIAVVVLELTAPQHHSSGHDGLWLAFAAAPLAALTVAAGRRWRTRSTRPA